MKRAFFRLLRRWLPPRTVAWLTYYQRNRYTGPYSSWTEARAHSTGYDAPDILARVTVATRAVVAGQAAFERDSVAFAEPDPDPRLLEQLSRLARARGSLCVLDFGGALGGSYHQYRRFLPATLELKWLVVEQRHYVDRGTAEFQTSELRFHHTLASAHAESPPDLVLLSSVLQYLDAPWSTLAELIRLPAKAWVISRTPFHPGDRDLAIVQHVPKTIYRASYPSWVLAETRLMRFQLEHGLQLTWHTALEGTIDQGKLHFTYRTADLHRP